MACAMRLPRLSAGLSGLRVNFVSGVSMARSRPGSLAASRYSAIICSAGGSPSITDRLKEDMKAAMKAKEQFRLDTIRFLQAAIKSREIELREKGGAVDDEEVIRVIQKMAKQRKDSIEQYTQGGRPDLAEKEASELKLLEAYLPAQMTAEELEAIVAAAVAEAGATSAKQMGAVMKLVMAKTAGRADNKAINDAIKAKLGAAK